MKLEKIIPTKSHSEYFSSTGFASKNLLKVYGRASTALEFSQSIILWECRAYWNHQIWKKL